MAQMIGIYLENKVKDLFKDDNTIELTIKFGKLATLETIIGNYGGSNAIWYQKNASDQWRMCFNGGQRGVSTYVINSTSEIYKISYVFDKANSLVKVYVNGEEEYSLTYDGFATYNYDWNNVYIGRNYSSDVIRPLKATIYAVRMYDKALTPEEIQQNYNLDNQKY